MNIDPVCMISFIIAFVSVRFFWTSIQIDRCQMEIMKAHGAWKAQCVKYREIFFQVLDFALKAFQEIVGVLVFVRLC